MPSCQVVPEPTNTADQNALKVQIHLKNEWVCIGYVSVYQILKVKSAIVKNEITSIELNRPKYKQNKNQDLTGYFCTVNITKKNRWMDDDPDAFYNMPMNI